MKLKLGIAGVGYLGRHHARKFSAMAGVDLCGVYDVNPDNAKQIAEELNLHIFSSYDELLAACQAVDIVATTSAHFELAHQALQAGKHVFVEKPITAELAQAKTLVEVAAQNKLILQVGHIERFNPVILAVEEEIKNPMFIESHRLSTFQPRGTDVPVVLDLMIHDIDLILDFVDSPVKDIHASGVGILTPSIDIANARIEFANGAIANVTSSRVSMKQERKIRFFQKDAYFSLDFGAKHATVLKRSPDALKYLPRILAGDKDIKAEHLVDIRNFDLSDTNKDALTLELESFVNSVLNDKLPIVDGRAGSRALDVALRIIETIGTQPRTHI